MLGTIVLRGDLHLDLAVQRLIHVDVEILQPNAVFGSIPPSCFQVPPTK
jgi:hypothetical protein